jgi:hypothetical protein
MDGCHQEQAQLRQTAFGKCMKRNDILSRHIISTGVKKKTDSYDQRLKKEKKIDR